MKYLFIFSLLQIAVAFRYDPVDPVDISLADQYRPLNASGETGADNGKVFVIKEQSDGSLGWSQVECNNATVLREHLEMDATRHGKPSYEASESTYGHGSCCVNQHHYICQLMIREINKCDVMKLQTSKQLPAQSTITLYDDQNANDFDFSKIISTSSDDCLAVKDEVEAALRVRTNDPNAALIITLDADGNLPGGSSAVPPGCMITFMPPATYEYAFNTDSGAGSTSPYKESPSNNIYYGINNVVTDAGPTTGPIDVGFNYDMSCYGITAPTNGGMGECTTSLRSGESCSITCNAGFVPTGDHYCYTRNLKAAECVPTPCDASVVQNGEVGDCTATLSVGSTCTPICHGGFNLTRIATCDGNGYTPAVCSRLCPSTQYHNGSSCVNYAFTSCPIGFTLTEGTDAAQDNSACNKTCATDEYLQTSTTITLYDDQNANDFDFSKIISTSSDDCLAVKDEVEAALRVRTNDPNAALIITLDADGNLPGGSSAVPPGCMITFMPPATYEYAFNTDSGAGSTSPYKESPSNNIYYGINADVSSSCAKYSNTLSTCQPPLNTYTQGTAAASDDSACVPNPCDATTLIANAISIGTCNTTTLASGTTCDQECNVGFYLSQKTSCDHTTLTQGICSVCPAGSVTDTLASGGATLCTECPDGTFDHDSDATTACQACPPHSHDDDGDPLTACVTCPPGTDNLDGGACDVCSPHEYSASGEACKTHAITSCAAGEFFSFGTTVAANSSFCTPCPNGTYTESNGHTQTSCAAWSTDQSQCDAGETFIEGTGTPTSDTCLQNWNGETNGTYYVPSGSRRRRLLASMTEEVVLTGTLSLFGSESDYATAPSKIEAASGSRHFTVDGTNSLKLTHLRLTGGDAADGGSVLMNGGSLDIAYCKFEENKASRGGAIFVKETAVVSVANAEISSNNATSEGGGIYSEGDLSLTDTVMEGNEAKVVGGGVYVSKGTVVLTRGAIKKNRVKCAGACEGGGGLAVKESAVVDIRESSFELNEVDGSTDGHQILTKKTASGTPSVTIVNTNFESAGTGDDFTFDDQGSKSQGVGGKKECDNTVCTKGIFKGACQAGVGGNPGVLCADTLTCAAGTYFVPVTDSLPPSSECRPHSTSCPSGFFLGTGTATADACKPCPPNHYQGTSDFTGASCTAFSTSCPVGSYLGTGTSTQDTCKQCAAGSAQGVPNFTGDSCTLCAAGSYQGSTGEGACVTCPPGSETDTGATVGATTCTPCGSGMFSADGHTCSVWTVCINSTETSTPTATSDRKCGCDDGEYVVGGQCYPHSSPTCGMQTDGTSRKIDGTPSNDAYCEPCDTGSYARLHEDNCTQWTSCRDDEIDVVSANATQDRQCGCPVNHYEGTTLTSLKSSGAPLTVNTVSGALYYSYAMTSISTGTVVAFTNSDADGNGVFARLYDTSFIPVGNEFQVNTFTSSTQQYPVIAAVGTGFVVVWESNGQDDEYQGIFAQLYDGNGGKIGSEFQVNTQGFGRQRYPQVAALGTGFVVAWESSKIIYFQRFDANGGKIGTEAMVNPNCASVSCDQEDVTVAGGSSGFMFVYESRSNSIKDVKGVAYDASGNIIGGEFQVNTDTSHTNLWRPRVGALGNGYVVSWRRQTANDNYMYAQILDGSGTKIGSEFQVTTQGLTYESDFATVGTGFVLSYRTKVSSDMSDLRIFAQLFDASGSKIGSAIEVYQKASPLGEARVTGLSDGVAIMYAPADGFVYTQLYEFEYGPACAECPTGAGPLASDVCECSANHYEEPPSLTASGGNFAVNSITSTSNNDQTDVDVASLGTGFVTVYHQSFDVYAQIYNAQKSPVGPRIQVVAQIYVNGYGYAHPQFPVVTSVSDGFVVAFELQVGASAYDMYARKFDASGTPLGASFRVDENVNADYKQHSPAITSVGNRFVIAWHARYLGSTTYNVWARVYEASGSAVGPSFQVNSGGTGRQWLPSVASVGDNFVVTWANELNQIDAQMYDASGNVIGSNFKVNNAATWVSGDTQDVASVGTGFVVSYTRTSRIYAQMFDGSGNKVGTEISVSTSVTSKHSSIAAVGSGFLIAYHFNPSGGYTDVHAQLFDSSGKKAGSKFTVNTYTTNNQQSPAVASFGSGALIAFEGRTSGSPSKNEATVQHYLYNGATCTACPAGQGSSAGGACEACPAGHYSLSGGACTAWSTCPAGQQPSTQPSATADSGACEACSASTFSTADDTAACVAHSTACNPGFFLGSGTSSTDTCTPCPSGHFQSESDFTGTACTAFSVGVSAQTCYDNDESYTVGSPTADFSCNACPAGTGAPLSSGDSTECTECIAGYGGNGTHCSICPATQYQVDHSLISVPCADKACPAGEGVGSLDGADHVSDDCVACGLNQYTADTSTGQCAYCSGHKQTQLVDTVGGAYSASSSIHCVNCANGFENEDGAACEACVANANSVSGSACVCNTGYKLVRPWVATTLSEPLIGTTNTGFRVKVIDLDGDGLLDIVYSNEGNNYGVGYYRNTGTDWTHFSVDSSSRYFRGVEVVDYDHDGDLDIVSISDASSSDENDGSIDYYENGNSWTKHNILNGLTSSSNTKVGNIAAADVDSDGDVDLAVSLGAYWHFFENENGAFNLKQLGNGGSRIQNVEDIAFADIDGDGKIDAVSCNRGLGRVQWVKNYDNDLHTLWVASPRLPISVSYNAAEDFTQKIQSIAVADMDGDGYVDVVSVSNDASSKGVQWHRNVNGDGLTWTHNTVKDISTTWSFTRVAVQDIDGDGDLDIVTSETAPDDVIRWFENTAGAGNTPTWTEHILASTESRDVALVDINADGKVDVVSGSKPYTQILKISKRCDPE